MDDPCESLESSDELLHALAASKAGGARMTETGMSLGTPHYMSPEQAMGEREITARSDVYALGCVLYEMLLGEPPFTGPTAQSIVAKVMSEKPARLTSRRDRIPPEVEDAVLTALEKLPADRFATAAEFAAALDAVAGAAQVLSPLTTAAAPDDAAGVEAEIARTRTAIEAMSSDPSPAARDRVAEGFTALAGALDALNPALGLEA